MAVHAFAGIRQRLCGDLAAALLRTFFARGIAAVGSFVLVVILARIYGASGVGVFALAQSLILAISVFGRWGMNNALMRFVGRDLSSAKVPAYLRYACIKAGLISVCGAVVMFFLRDVAAGLFHSTDLAGVLIGVVIATPAFVMCFIFAGFMAAVRKPANACLMQNGAISLVTAVTVIMFHHMAPLGGLVDIGVAYAVAAWVVCIWGSWVTWRWLRNHGFVVIGASYAISSNDVRGFRRSSSAFLATDIASFLISVVGIWAAGYWLTTIAVGQYKAAWQISMLIGVTLTVINLIVPARFASLFHTNDVVALERLARRGALIGLILGTPPLILCLVAPSLVLHVVGHGFGGAAPALQILAIGQLFNLGCGSVGHLLNMTGHEPLTRNIAWVANVVGLGALVVGALWLGVAGVAFGVSLAIVLRKTAGVYYAWRRLGIWMLPMPNFLAFIGLTGPRLSVSIPRH